MLCKNHHRFVFWKRLRVYANHISLLQHWELLDRGAHFGQIDRCFFVIRGDRFGTEDDAFF